MSSSNQSRYYNYLHSSTLLQFLSRESGTVVALIGTAVVLGWLVNVEALKRVLPGLPAMNMTTALCFILAGSGLRLWHQQFNIQQRPARKWVRFLIVNAACLTVLIALLTLFEYSFRVNLGIDQFLLAQPESIGSSSAPRMAPNTALSFSLLGTALLLMLVQHSKYWVAHSLVVMAWLLSFLALLGHIHGSDDFYAVGSYTGTALHTTIACLLLSTGMLWAAPDQGLMRLMTGTGVGSLMARQVLPLTIILLPIISGLSETGFHQQVYGAEIQATLVSILDVLLFSGLVIWNARKLNLLDDDRCRAEAALQQTNEVLEQRVEERTAQLCYREAQLKRAKSVLEGRVAERTAELQQLNDRLQQELVDRLQTEAALRESQERFHRSFHDAAIGMALVDCQGRFIQVNTSLCNIVGYSESELLGLTFQDITHPDDLEADLNYARQLLSGKIPTYQMEKRYVHKSRYLVWILLSVSLVRNEQEQPLYFIAQIQNISDRKRSDVKRRQAEAILQANEQFLRSIYDGVEQSIFVVDVLETGDFRFVGLNLTHERLTGLQTKDLQGKTPEQVLPPAAAAAVRQNYQHCVEVGETITYEECLPFAGQDTWWITSLTPLRNEQSRIHRIVGSSVNISDRKHIEEALRQSEATQRAIIQAFPDLLIRMRADGTYLDFIASSEINIINPEQIHQGVHIYEVLPFSLAQERLHYVQQALQTRKIQIYEYQLLVKGKRCNEEARIIPMENDEILVTVRDITARKSAEEQLQKSEAMLREAQRVAHIGNWELDVATRKITWSDELFRIFGFDLSDPEPAYIEHFNYIHPDDRSQLQTYLDRAMTEGTAFEIDLRISRTDGLTRYLEARGESVRDKNGQVIQLFGTALDITDRKQIELELQQAKRAADLANQSKSVFLANMSHELRTPLNVILGFAQVMGRDPLLTPEQKEHLQIIHRSGDHLLNLISDILDLSKIEAGCITLDESSFGLLDLMRSLWEMFRQRAEAKGLQLNLEVAPDVPAYITTDANKLRQVIINLLSNAIKFTEIGAVTLRVKIRNRAWGKKSIEPEQTPLPTPHSPLSTPHSPFPSHSLIVEIEDTGVGIPAADLESIFDPFVQTEAGKISPQGTGLGLTISRKFLQSLGGDIVVSSTLGEGSTFRFALPVQLAKAANIPATQTHRRVIGLAPGQRPYRVLVVDDQPENRQLLMKLLTLLGLEAREAANGKEAVQLSEQWQPHLVWMDIRMPVLDGYEATQQIRSIPEGQSTVIIALTAQASKSDRTLALSAGCNDYVSKPFKEEVLFAKMAEHLGLQYLYAERNSAESRLTESRSSASSERLLEQLTAQPAGTELTIEHLAVMPPTWNRELHQAALYCDDEEVLRLIAQIPAANACVADRLSQLAHDYQFKQIVQLTQPLDTQPDYCQSSRKLHDES